MADESPALVVRGYALRASHLTMWASLRRINFLRLGARSHSTLILSPSKDKGGP